MGGRMKHPAGHGEEELPLNSKTLPLLEAERVSRITRAGGDPENVSKVNSCKKLLN